MNSFGHEPSIAELDLQIQQRQGTVTSLLDELEHEHVCFVNALNSRERASDISEEAICLFTGPVKSEPRQSFILSLETLEKDAETLAKRRGNEPPLEHSVKRVKRKLPRRLPCTEGAKKEQSRKRDHRSREQVPNCTKPFLVIEEAEPQHLHEFADQSSLSVHPQPKRPRPVSPRESLGIQIPHFAWQRDDASEQEDFSALEPPPTTLQYNHTRGVSPHPALPHHPPAHPPAHSSLTHKNVQRDPPPQPHRSASHAHLLRKPSAKPPHPHPHAYSPVPPDPSPSDYESSPLSPVSSTHRTAYQYSEDEHQTFVSPAVHRLDLVQSLISDDGWEDGLNNSDCVRRERMKSRWGKNWGHIYGPYWFERPAKEVSLQEYLDVGELMPADIVEMLSSPAKPQGPKIEPTAPEPASYLRFPRTNEGSLPRERNMWQKGFEEEPRPDL